VDVAQVPRFSRLLFSSVVLLGIFAGACFAPETPREPLIGQRDGLAQVYLSKKLSLWQHRLSLQDWNVTLVVSPSHELRNGTLGNIRWDVDKKTAAIRVLDASEYHMPFRAALDDMEFTVVHELIHLELESLPRNEASRGEEEFAVNHMADALLRLERQDRDRNDFTLANVAAPKLRTGPQ
jgi:hypothetical protein